MNTQPECGNVPSREQKHIVLNDSLRSLREVKDHANNLLNQIRETNDPEEILLDNCKEPHPSLLYVLDETPGRINKQCAEIREILNQIRELIF